MVNNLSLQDETVLKHVARYRLTTPEILAQTKLFSETDAAEANSTLETLSAGGWLAKASMNPGHTAEAYYHLTPRAAQKLGHDPEFGRPLARETRVEAYAIAKFCCGSDRFRQLLTKNEFKEKFRALWFPGQPVRYYIEPGEGTVSRLAFLKVDHGGHGRWERLIDSCSQFLDQRTDVKRVAPEHRKHVEAYAEIVKRGQFQFTVLTALAEKKRSIGLELERREAKGEKPPPIQVHVISELFELLFPESTPARGKRRQG